MSLLVRSKQLKTIAGIGLVLYGAIGHHGLFLIVGVALIGWGVVQAARLRRRQRSLDNTPPSTALCGQGLRPPFGGSNP
jgi:hypothetical protein